MNINNADIDNFSQAFHKSNILTDYLLKMNSNNNCLSSSNLHNPMKTDEISNINHLRGVTSPISRMYSDKKDKIRSPKIIFNRQKNTSTSFLSLFEEDNDIPIIKSNRISTMENSVIQKRVKSKSPDSNPSISNLISTSSSGTNVNMKSLVKKELPKQNIKSLAKTVKEDKNLNGALNQSKQSEKNNVFKAKRESKEIKDITTPCVQCVGLKNKINLLTKKSTETEVKLFDEEKKKIEILEISNCLKMENSLLKCKLDHNNKIIVELENKCKNLEEENCLFYNDQVNIEELDYLRDFKESIIEISKVYDDVNKALFTKFNSFEDELKNLSNYITSSKVKNTTSISQGLKELSNKLANINNTFNSTLKLKHNEYLILLNNENKMKTTEINFDEFENKAQNSIIMEPLDENSKRGRDQNTNNNHTNKIKSHSPTQNEYNIDYLNFNSLKQQIVNNQNKENNIKEGKYSKLIKSFK